MKLKEMTMLLSASIIGGTAYAQDTYDAARFAGSDLNGTARYVGMGGALGALGGDISVMGNNPAGTAMFRRSDIALTLSGVFTDEGALGHDKARMSIDNAGVIIATNQHNRSSSGLQYVNFGVNIAKRNNFLGNHNIGVEHLNGVFSQTYQIADMANNAYDTGNWGMLADMSAPEYDKDGKLVHDGIIGELFDEAGNLTGYTGIGANEANFKRATYGSNLQTDINLSLNFSERYFVGISLGLYSIDYNRESYYEEMGSDGHYYDLSNWYATNGDGFDVKLGFICRPFENSPFRIGFHVHTPTWYKMDDTNGSMLYMDDEFVSQKASEPYDYSYRTPWKLGLSLGHTVGKQFAIGAEYEYMDYSTCKYYTNDWSEDSYFRNINSFTKNMMKAQHTLKLGVEYKPIDEFSVRFGYNYVSSPYKNDAFRTIAYDSPFTETDFTNWKDIQRITIGMGYRYKGGYIDLAYQYSTQKGDFYAFDDIDLKPTEINNDRSQLMCTFGFKF